MDKEVLHIYGGILPVIKKNKIMLFAATWVELEINILSKLSQRVKDRYHMIPLTCGM